MPAALPEAAAGRDAVARRANARRERRQLLLDASQHLVGEGAYGLHVVTLVLRLQPLHLLIKLTAERFVFFRILLGKFIHRLHEGGGFLIGFFFRAGGLGRAGKQGGQNKGSGGNKKGLAHTVFLFQKAVTGDAPVSIGGAKRLPGLLSGA
ncbi:MAG TPA: hypothetical protein H9784_09740 [Candidatus Desulfovibrio intestinavium]|uniref:Uncharacterized protein n=1 Tax=Candidatus Desulfovibrio intestinavium TaxID=2838534 RepID=A0A9D2KQI7_9BACT|nr:hypothetical protein [Candidatus Desulfovibrio intestinavium]